MRLIDGRNSTVEELLQDIFWPIDLCPDHVVNCLLTFKYTDRISVCNFFFGNGMNLADAFRIISFYHNGDPQKLRLYEKTFSDLWIYLKTAVQRTHIDWERIITHYYFYSMITKSVLFFDGTIRLNGNKVNVQHNSNIGSVLHIPHSTNEIQIAELRDKLAERVCVTH